ncbi:MAG: transglutaminase family protein [Anaerolineae bacterium]|nr:transglutaminase family protein [Anaerolineae bacterium]
MYYSINHVTRFRYDSPVRESFVEMRMRPRYEGVQRPHSFEISTSPRAHLMSYRDYLNNTIDYFNIPAEHTRLTITVQALVDMTEPPMLPDALSPDTWQVLDAITTQADFWEMLHPSRFAKPTDLLGQLASELGIQRRDDPLTLLKQLNTQLHEAINYVQDKTKVDSPIDDALKMREGVCQDYAHIMIALVRQLGIPCRYVSGYLFRRSDDESAEGSSHAWVEALLPELGWVGFDPTNNILARERHIRVAIGRDYADVPPTRGVFKGDAESELAVAVKVRKVDNPAPQDEFLEPIFQTTIATPAVVIDDDFEAQQQRQQQQQQQQQ